MSHKRPIGRKTSAEDIKTWSHKKLTSEIKKCIRIDLGGNKDKVKTIIKKAAKRGIVLSEEQSKFSLDLAVASCAGSRKRIDNKLIEIDRRLSIK